jgi:thiamine monophosphate kinase
MLDNVWSGVINLSAIETFAQKYHANTIGGDTTTTRLVTLTAIFP